MTRIGNTKTTTSYFFLLAIVLSTIFQIRPLLFSGIVGDVVSIQQRQLSKELESNIPSIIKTKESNNTDYYIISDQSNIHNNDLSPRTTNTTTTEGPIFYNAYVPIGENKTNNAIKIIKEQLNERSKTSYGSSIIYTLIGNKHVDPIIQQECQPNCTQRAYLPSGDEVDTLQGLWEHCQDHPTDIVTYIHDKGSFHPSGSNSAARRVGTKAALTCRGLLLDHHLPQIETDENETDDSGEEGVNSTKTENQSNNKNKENNQCNICSYRFYAFPVFHARANMWSATCSYIQNLIPPKDYELSVRTMYEETVNHTVLGPTKYGCLQPPDDSRRFLGLERYAMERWAFNHPDVQACDSVSKFEVRKRKQKKKSAANFKPSLTHAPQRRAVTSGIRAIRTSWERLAGRLFEWNYLYNKSPSKTSWVWKYYKGHEVGTKEYLANCSQLQEESIKNMSDQIVNGKPLLEFLSLDR